ncbi:MAG: RCC1 domain-containing protein, partial [Verrucomicrobiota bacterium]
MPEAGRPVIIPLPGAKEAGVSIPIVPASVDDVIDLDISHGSTGYLLSLYKSDRSLMVETENRGLHLGSLNAKRVVEFGNPHSIFHLSYEGEVTAMKNGERLPGNYQNIYFHPSGCYGLTADGEIQLIAAGAISEEYSELAKLPQQNRNIVSLSFGNSHAVALTRTGEVISWGEDIASVISQSRAELGPFRSAIAVRNSTVAISRSGRIVGWGAGITGREQTVFDELVEISDAEEAFSAIGGKVCIRRTGRRWIVLNPPTEKNEIWSFAPD